MNTQLKLVVGDKVEWKSNNGKCIGVVLEDDAGMVTVITHYFEGRIWNQEVIVDRKKVKLYV